MRVCTYSTDAPCSAAPRHHHFLRGSVLHPVTGNVPLLVDRLRTRSADTLGPPLPLGGRGPPREDVTIGGRPLCAATRYSLAATDRPSPAATTATLCGPSSSR